MTEVDDTGGVINVKLAEMVVGNLNLRYVDRKTGEVREEGATRPEVVLRQLATRPGQVCTPCHAALCLFATLPRNRAELGSSACTAGLQCAAGQDGHRCCVQHGLV